MKKRGICILLAIVLTILLLPTSALAMFFDSAGHWAENAIDRWFEYEVVSGYEDGSFRPETEITRAEMAAILARLLLLQEKSDKSFADLSTDA